VISTLLKTQILMLILNTLKKLPKYHSKSYQRKVIENLIFRHYITKCVKKFSALILLGDFFKGIVTSENIGGSGVTSTLGTWYGGVVMGVSFV
jgi:hypothetical protein